jgi:hypothetical protein
MDLATGGSDGARSLAAAKSSEELQTIKSNRTKILFDFGVLRCQNCCGDATFIHSYWLA